jgi:hypothetical protein
MGSFVTVDLTSLATTTSTVDFRFYTYNNTGPLFADRRGFRGSAIGDQGLRILGTLTFLESNTFDVTGVFQYQDRLSDRTGYTGLTQNLPVRHAEIECVNADNGSVLFRTTTTSDGSFAGQLTLAGLADLYIRVLTTTGVNSNYPLVVGFDTQGLTIHSAQTDVVTGHDPANDLDFGTWLIEDTDGMGVAQAFNIFDRVIDGMDWLAQPQALGRYPNVGENLIVRWSATANFLGSYYTDQTITIASPSSGDTDGWDDAVILHEFGHYVADVFHQDDSPGGAHYLGDNFQNPALSYGEGYATYLAAEVRAFTALTAGTDAHVTIYGDNVIPPPLPMPGGFGFGYDYEAAEFNEGDPLFQVGQASETAVTSTMWDIVDGPTTPDESPGVDDDPLDGDNADVWMVLRNYMRLLDPSVFITFEDFFQGWKSVHGDSYQASELAEIFNTVNRMGFAADPQEPNDQPASATVLTPHSPNFSGTGGVVINEVCLGTVDGIELFNASSTDVNLATWKIVCSTNTASGTPELTADLPAVTLAAGEYVWILENGDGTAVLPFISVADFSVPWWNTEAGACELWQGSTPVDFVRWDGVDGPSNTPVPAGLTFTGSVFSPTTLHTLGRDAASSDTDDASDWQASPISLVLPNGLSSISNTIFQAGDVDYFRMPAEQGKVYRIRTSNLYGGTRTEVRLFTPDGSTQLALGAEIGGGVHDASLSFLAQHDADYIVRIDHDTDSSGLDYGMYDIRVDEHPTGNIFGQLSKLQVDAQNAAVVGDQVYLEWLSPGIFDETTVEFYDGIRNTQHIIPGSESRFYAYLDQGLYKVDVWSELDGQSTYLIRAYFWAGPIPTTLLEQFDQSNLHEWPGPWLRHYSLYTSPPRSATDSPVSNYAPNTDESLETRVSVLVGHDAELSFQHICIVEDQWDSGRVEVTADDGETWDELARYDEGDHPEWLDGVAENTDWKLETLSLADYEGKIIRVRFRLVSNGTVQRDGWYVDDISITSAGLPTTTLPLSRLVYDLKPNSPNPFNPSTIIEYSLPQPETVDLSVYDLRGRRVRTLVQRRVEAGVHRATWQGHDDHGKRVGSGVYFYKLKAGSYEKTRKLVLVE